MRHYTIFAALLMLMLTDCNRGTEKMLSALEQQGVGMIIDNHGERTTYSLPGVQDLLHLTADEPERLHGAVVTDKRVGKAAACLLIEGGVKRVNTLLVSTPAKQMLQAAGIPLYAREEIPLMVNKDGTDLCPMEKKLLDAKTPEQCAAILRGASIEGFQMLDMLNEQGLSLLVFNHGELTTHANRGVQDLLQLISEQPERLQGAVVADKIIGKAAAAIMATGGVREVHTNIICTPAKQLFEQQGILIFATEEVPMILNRDRSSMCPIDTQIADIESIEECVAVLQVRLAH
jgi:predicted Fe-Mo cluster-binding NifX family protein